MTTDEPLVNNGERLYYQNIAHGVLRQSKIEKTKKNEEEDFKMEFSFQPNINKNENDKYSDIHSKYKQIVPPQKLSEENHLRNTIEPKREEEIKKMINRLHSESKKFKENKEKLYKEQTKEECPFSPKINVQGKSDPKYFMMRLEKWNKKMEEKIKKNEGEQKLNFDKTTGQKLFQPKVDDPVAKQIKRENENVHFDLYQKGLEHIDYRKKIMETDTRDDLEQIENNKKEKINKLKEERDRYKKEKQEKLEKEIYERSLKAKAEKENIKQVLKERTKKEQNKEEKNQGKKNIKNKEKIKDIETKKKKFQKNIFDIGIQKSISPQKKINNNKTLPLNSKQKVNTETTKLKSTKETKENKNKLKKIPIKKDYINERAQSQPQKNKTEISKEKKNKTITYSINKDKKIENSLKKKIENIPVKAKQISGNEKRVKTSKNDKNIIIKNSKK